jgi:hypothetical protein
MARLSIIFYTVSPIFSNCQKPAILLRFRREGQSIHEFIHHPFRFNILVLGYFSYLVWILYRHLPLCIFWRHLWLCYFILGTSIVQVWIICDRHLALCHPFCFRFFLLSYLIKVHLSGQFFILLYLFLPLLISSDDFLQYFLLLLYLINWHSHSVRLELSHKVFNEVFSSFFLHLGDHIKLLLIIKARVKSIDICRGLLLFLLFIVIVNLFENWVLFFLILLNRRLLLLILILERRNYHAVILIRIKIIRRLS